MARQPIRNAAFAARVIRAHARRIADGDVEGLARVLWIMQGQRRSGGVRPRRDRWSSEPAPDRRDPGRVGDHRPGCPGA